MSQGQNSSLVEACVFEELQATGDFTEAEVLSRRMALSGVGRQTQHMLTALGVATY